jgi:hypothetical protein
VESETSDLMTAPEWQVEFNFHARALLIQLDISVEAGTREIATVKQHIELLPIRLSAHQLDLLSIFVDHECDFHKRPICNFVRQVYAPPSTGSP